MRRRTKTLAVLAAMIPAAAAGVAVATPPSGLTSQLLARGAAGEFELEDRSGALEIEAERPTDVAVVRATLAPGGTTGWHGHPGPSLVVVNAGAITMYEPRHHGSGCSVRTFAAGSAFVHPEHEHTFVNRTTAPAEFHVVYLVPAGATPLLTDVPTVPAGCR